jgi:cathepsin L
MPPTKRRPFQGVNSVCRSNGTAKSAFFSGYQTIEEGDEEALMEALALRGPLYVALDAGSASFKYYSSGVYHRADCGTKDNQLNHAVTLVGYGTTDDGVDYWLIRNSWSKLWGDSGYMKVTRRGNDCGITTRAVQAVVDPIAAGKVRAKVEAAKGKANVDQE